MFVDMFVKKGDTYSHGGSVKEENLETWKPQQLFEIARIVARGDGWYQLTYRDGTNGGTHQTIDAALKSACAYSSFGMYDKYIIRVI